MIGTSQAEDWTDEVMHLLAVIVRPTVALVVEEVLASVGRPWRPDRLPSSADRQEAAGLWAMLRDSSATERELLLEEAREYWNWAVCELACAESVTAASHSAERALEFAGLAVEISGRVLGNLSQRTQGYASVHLATPCECMVICKPPRKPL